MSELACISAKLRRQLLTTKLVILPLSLAELTCSICKLAYQAGQFGQNGKHPKNLFPGYPSLLSWCGIIGDMLVTVLVTFVNNSMIHQATIARLKNRSCFAFNSYLR